MAANRFATVGDDLADRQGLGPERDGDGRSGGQRRDLRPADQAAQRGPDHDLAPGVGRLDLPLDQVDRAEELRDEGIDRAVVDLTRRPRLDDSPEVHDGQVVGQGEGLAGVGGEDERRGLGLGDDPADLVAELGPDPVLEPAERVVEDDQVGLEHQGPGQGQDPSPHRDGRRSADGRAVR